MPKGIDQFVSENRRDLRRVDQTLVEVASNRPLRFNFGNNTIRIPTSIEVYTRPMNDGLISGHPDSKHGSGRGVSGDVRGDWVLQEDVEVSEEFVRGGRNAVRDALSGDPDADIAKIAVGNGTSTVQPTDTTLQSENGRRTSWSKQGATAEEVDSIAYFRFHEFGDSVSEYGLVSDVNTLMNRIVTETINPGASEELRVDINLEVNGDGAGNSAITNDGEEAIAESIRSDNNVGIEEYVFGDNSTDPAKTDTSLGNQLFSKVAQRNIDPEVVTAFTVLMENEPNTQPHTIQEIGIKDNTGRLIWRATVESFDKDSETQFEVYAGFRAK